MFGRMITLRKSSSCTGCKSTAQIGDRVEMAGPIGTVTRCPVCILTLVRCGVVAYTVDRTQVIKNLAGLIELAKYGTVLDAADLARILRTAPADVKARAIQALDKINTKIMDGVIAIEIQDANQTQSRTWRRAA